MESLVLELIFLVDRSRNIRRLANATSQQGFSMWTQSEKDYLLQLSGKSPSDSGTVSD